MQRTCHRAVLHWVLTTSARRQVPIYFDDVVGEYSSDGEKHHRHHGALSIFGRTGCLWIPVGEGSEVPVSMRSLRIQAVYGHESTFSLNLDTYHKGQEPTQLIMSCGTRDQ